MSAALLRQAVGSAVVSVGLLIYGGRACLRDATRAIEVGAHSMRHEKLAPAPKLAAKWSTR